MPFWIPVAIGVCALFYVAEKVSSEKCDFCSTEGHSIERCEICSKKICEACSKKETFYVLDRPSVKYCPSCGKTNKELLSYWETLPKIATVETFSKNYKGKIPIAQKIKEVSTQFCENKSHAEDGIKYQAVLLGGDVVYDLEYVKKTNSYGAYVYSIWSATGTVGLSKK